MIVDLVLRFISWAFRKFGKQTLAALALLLTILITLVIGLVDSIREAEFGALLFITILGAVTGWLLARLPWRDWVLLLIALALGFALIFFRIGGIGRPFFAAAFTLDSLPWSSLSWGAEPVEFITVLVEFWTGIGTLAARFLTWTRNFISGDAAFDPVSSAVFWSLLAWIVSAWSGWAVRRWQQPLLGVAPAAALLAVIISYVRGPSALMLPVLGSVLALNALSQHGGREQRWLARQVDIFEDFRTDLAVGVVLSILVVITLAAFIPSISFRRIYQLTRNLVQPPAQQSEKAGQSLGLRRKPTPTGPLYPLRAPGLPRSHLLGSGPELSEDVVMEVSTGDLPPMPPENVSGYTVPRYYWRSITYDRYTGFGWVTGGTQTWAYSTGASAVASEQTTYKLLHQQVQPRRDLGGLIHAAGILAGVNKDYTIDWRRAPANPEVLPSPEEVDLFGASLATGGAYEAVSLVPYAPAEQLREAGSEYPDWITQTYLRLPNTVPSRVLGLARDLTATEPTPYDRAVAIQDYLRTYPYNLDVPAPPSGQDVSDFFLFQLKEGYCDYYATAMVVLARAAGLPARLVIGYASGSYDSLNTRYIVTEADAHSWPEIYFPDFGWIEFEPTTGRPAIERPDQGNLPEISAVPQAPSTGANLNWKSSWKIWPFWIAVLIALAGGFLLTVSVIDAVRLRQLSPEKAIAILYRRLYREGQDIAPPSRGATPYEFIAGLRERLGTLSQRSRWRNQLQSAAREALSLTELHIRTVYSPHPPRPSEQRQAIGVWNRLRWRLWLAKLMMAKPPGPVQEGWRLRGRSGHNQHEHSEEFLRD